MTKKTIRDFARKYGFRVAILLFVLFLLLKKDFSFQMRLKSPTANITVDSLEEVVKPAEAVEEVNSQRLGLPAFWNGGTKLPNPGSEPFDGIKTSTVKSFLDRFAHVAKADEKKFGIPAKLILAHGLMMSRGGTAPSTQNGNNYFGVPCTAGWEGPRNTIGGKCSRSYPTAWTSFRDFSLFITRGENEDLKKLDTNNLSSWVKALAEGSFRRVKDYEKRMNKLLQEIDQEL